MYLSLEIRMEIFQQDIKDKSIVDISTQEILKIFLYLSLLPILCMKILELFCL